MERAGGQVLAVDFGRVTEGSPDQWLKGAMLGVVSKHHRCTAKERSGKAQARAVVRGVLPWPKVTPGYPCSEDGVPVPDPDPDTALAAEAFRMHAHGTGIKEAREFLRSAGIIRPFHGVGTLLCSRIVLGEIHFGGRTNMEAHEPIVDQATCRKAQRLIVPGGRSVKSQRLLARLGVLRSADDHRHLERHLRELPLSNQRRLPEPARDHRLMPATGHASASFEAFPRNTARLHTRRIWATCHAKCQPTLKRR